MTSRCRNIWETLSNADMSTSSSVTLHQPDAHVKVPFASNGREGKHSAVTSFSKNNSHGSWTRWKYDHTVGESLPKKPAIDRDKWSCDSGKCCSPFLKAECLRMKKESDSHDKVHTFTFENIHSPVVPVDLSEIKSNSKSIKSSGNNRLHHSNDHLRHDASKMECRLGAGVSPIFSVDVTRGVNCTNSMRRSNEGVSWAVASKTSVHLDSTAETNRDRLKTEAATNRHSFSRTNRGQKRARDNCNPILSRVEFGDYLHLNEANFISVESRSTDSDTGQKASVKGDVTSSTEADLFVADFPATQDRCSKSVAELKQAKFDDSCDMFFEREKSVIHDAVVPVLVPDNSSSLADVGCHSSDLDVEMENLSEAEDDIPSFKCPFGIDELANFDEPDGPEIFLDADSSRDMPSRDSGTACSSTVSALHSDICDLTSPAMSSVSLSGPIISPAQLPSEGFSAGSCGDERSDTLIKPGDRRMPIDTNAYSELQQLYKSEQLSGDLLRVDRWSETDGVTAESLVSASSSATCEDHARPHDNGCNSEVDKMRTSNGETDSEHDDDGVHNVVEEVLEFLKTDACCHADAISQAEISVLRKTDSNKQWKFKNQLLHKSEILNSLELEVPLPDSCRGVAIGNMTNLNVSSRVDSAAPSPSTKLSKAGISILDPVSHLKSVALDSESCIPLTDDTRLVQKVSLEDSVAIKEMFTDEKKIAGHNLNLRLKPSYAETFNRPMTLKNFSCPSRKSQLLIPEFHSSVDNVSMSEDAISPCSVFPADECFLGTWSHPSEMRLCPSVHHDNMAKSPSDPSQASITYFNEPGLKTSLSDSEGLSMSSESPLSAETNLNFALLGGGTLFRADSGDEKNFQDSYSESGHSELSENPHYVQIDKCSRKIRRSRLLTEIANSNGYIAERKPSQSSGSLFVDSKMLSREERVLQMVHMQITKMEVKEELIKLKKNKRFTETCNQSIDSKKAIIMTGQFNRPVSHQKINCCTKLKSSPSCVSDGKRLEKGNLWSSRKFMQQQNFSSHYRKIQCKRRASDKVAKVKRKLKTANEVRKLRFRNLESRIVDLTDKRQIVSKDEQKNRSSVQLEALCASVNGTNSLNLSSVGFASAASKECNNKFNEIEESFCPPVPIIPSQVKRVTVCCSTGETILHKAARLGYDDVALWCCQSGLFDVDACDNAGYTPLHESCLSSQTLIAKYLIHYGADVNSTSGIDGRRPIHEAVESGCLETVRLLLSAGADVNLTTYSGISVLEISKSQEMKEFLNAYLSDLNGANSECTETEWSFIPSWSDDPALSGFDLLCDVPLCDPKCDEFYVELAAGYSEN